MEVSAAVESVEQLLRREFTVKPVLKKMKEMAWVKVWFIIAQTI